ncbi:globin domain-containing protein [Thermoactinomyces mirandus]|uniref:Globin n=1 Tax=Thermoactinomyces mirandus TaxID=2756294 RepID=A0A7W1XQ56_9BACL|nr:globin [Thermoactinomyces mirandus]MBA4601095.1 globin [Thermoactinomyces mirandus]
MKQQQESIYEKIGGTEKVRQLVEAFYPRVVADPLLKPLFPEDIGPVMEKQYMFLTQLLGGPSLYSDKYGLPMLRARHMPFPITPERAQAWLACMEQALDETGISGEERDAIWGRLVIAAHHMVNKSPSEE